MPAALLKTFSFIGGDYRFGDSLSIDETQAHQKVFGYGTLRSQHFVFVNTQEELSPYASDMDLTNCATAVDLCAAASS